MAVLLEELPLQHLGSRERVARHEVARIREKVNDRIRLGQRPPSGVHQHRDTSIRIQLKELGRVGAAGKNIDVPPLVGDLEQMQYKFYLVTVA